MNLHDGMDYRDDVRRQDPEPSASSHEGGTVSGGRGALYFWAAGVVSAGTPVLGQLMKPW